MVVIDGKKIAGDILVRLKSLPKPKKFLAGVLIGNDAASESFQNIKKRTAEELGIDYRIYKLDAALGNDGLRREVGKIAAHRTCGGVIVQLPLPEPLNVNYVVNVIPPEKDPDVLGERALGALYTGRGKVLQPAVATVYEVVQQAGFELKGTEVAIIGRGLLVGKPIAVSLMNDVSDLHVFGRDGDMSIVKQCDLVISGVGKAGLIVPEMLKDGAAVIDFGYSKKEGDTKLLGDFDPAPLATSHTQVAFYTPTPGGTGPILVAKLFENFYTLNADRRER